MDKDNMKHQIKSQGHFTIYLAVNAELAEELAFCAGGPRLTPHSGWGLLGICSARPVKTPSPAFRRIAQMPRC
ncbi:hypothetical protein GOB10_03200 [Sinorhizobium meliloti]|uniref:hypothetical protein n=1 Tax=Rhizobium meliloti TaxID=382 RepID=UPI00129572EC|nr:hypothetical protein [Sinorhizobium meliloti]MDW9894806.1 hypothetical protein [Sinorhizobium meliloti]MQW57473.1 hypothetical protein [Sinorhizobium meliloti]